MSIDAFLSISGHLYPEEGYLLQVLAANKRVLEIGSHHCRSAIAMAATALHVTTIDNFKGDAQIGAPSLAEAMENIQNSSLADKITLIVADWTKYIASPADLQSYDMLFYDAAHTPENPYEKDFLELCENFKGIIALHDYKPAEEGMKYVVQAVDDFEKRVKRVRQGPLQGTSIVYFTK